jgi:hypothetical protein
MEIDCTPYIGRFEILDNMVAVRSEFGNRAAQIDNALQTLRQRRSWGAVAGSKME